MNQQMQQVPPVNLFDPDPLTDKQKELPVLFMHIHIPKTGGTTFNTVLEKNFGELLARYEGYWIHVYPKINVQQVIRFLELYPGIKAATSHMFSVILPYHQMSHRIVSIAYMRDPVSRLFSFYFHLRYLPGADHPAKKYPLDDYIEQIRKGIIARPASALQQLTAADNIHGFNYVSQLVENGHLYLLPTENMDHGLSLLQRDFPSSFRDITYKRENISKRDQEVTKDHRERARELFSDFEWKLNDLAQQLLVNRS